MPKNKSLDKIKNLEPLSRLKKLKELEEQKKKEIDETKKLMKIAEADIEKDKLIEKIPVPDINEVNIDDLFNNEEKSLEEQVGSESQNGDIGFEGLYSTSSGLKQEIKEIYDTFSKLSYNANWSEEDYDSFYESSQKLNQIKSEFEKKAERGYTLSEEVANQLVLSKNVEYNIRKYKEFGH